MNAPLHRQPQMRQGTATHRPPTRRQLCVPGLEALCQLVAVVQLLQQALALSLRHTDALQQGVLVGGNGIELRRRGGGWAGRVATWALPQLSLQVAEALSAVQQVMAGHGL